MPSQAEKEASERFRRLVGVHQKTEAEMVQRVKALLACSSSACGEAPFDVAWFLRCRKQKAPPKTEATRTKKLLDLRKAVESMDYDRLKSLTECSKDKCEKETRAFFISRQKNLLSDIDRSLAMLEMLSEQSQPKPTAKATAKAKPTAKATAKATAKPKKK